MATYDYSSEAYQGVGLPVASKFKNYNLKRTIDLEAASQSLKAGAVFADGDIIKIFTIPAQSLVNYVLVTIDTAESTLTSYAIGSGTDANSGVADGFLSAESMATATTTTATADYSATTTNTTDVWPVAIGGGHYYHLEDTLDLTITTTTTSGSHTGVITIIANITDLS